MKQPRAKACQHNRVLSPAMTGAILAGGAGKRLGGISKAMLEIDGRPLAAIVAETLKEACDRVAVVCKSDTELPELAGVERWDEPAEPRHPIAGILHALERAGGPVFVCAADMPYVTPDACASVIAGAGAAPATVAAAGGVVQPLFAVYAPSALDGLRSAPADGRLTDAVEALRPTRVAVPPAIVRSVNTLEDLAAAEAALSP